MTTVKSTSKRKVLRLMTPPTADTGLDVIAPVGLTVRALIQHKRYKRLRDTYTVIRVEGDFLIPIASLRRAERARVE